MAPLDELQALLGVPADKPAGTDNWIELEQHVGSALPCDFKAFLDMYGTGVISGELVVFHPRGTTPLLERMRETNRRFTQRRDRAIHAGDLEDCPYPFHPEPGGLISWGYDHSGNEHFFHPCDADPERWQIVTMVHESGCETFPGPFSGFVRSFLERLSQVDPYHGIDPDALEYLEPEDLDELAATGEIGPVPPSFKPF